MAVVDNRIYPQQISSVVIVWKMNHKNANFYVDLKIVIFWTVRPTGRSTAGCTLFDAIEWRIFDVYVRN